MKALAVPVAHRVASAVVAAGTGSVLVLAAWLTPSSLGHSTHTQLGLYPCTAMQLTGYPCPMCGMTTSFALFAHLHPVAAVVNQPFSLVMFGLTVGAFAIGVSEAVQPRDRWVRIATAIEPYEGRLAAIFIALMTIGWLYKVVLVRGWLAIAT